MKNNINKLMVCFVVLFSATNLFGCAMLDKAISSSAEKSVTSRYANINPNSAVFKTQEGFDFIQMHNDIVDRLNEEGTDIFYITGNTLDIDGDNEKKEIHLKFEVFGPTSDKEIDLAISWMMKLIADEAALQQFKYEGATTESFGTVWNDYTLVATIERGQLAGAEQREPYVKTIKAGDPIPFEPRAITWGDDYIESEESAFEFGGN